MSFSTGPQGPAPHYATDWRVDLSKRPERRLTLQEDIRKLMTELQTSATPESFERFKEILTKVDESHEQTIEALEASERALTEASEQQITRLELVIEVLRADVVKAESARAAAEAEAKRLTDIETRVAGLDQIEAERLRALNEAREARSRARFLLDKIRSER